MIEVTRHRSATSRPRRLVVVARADPVICGHSGEARNLAEAALERGFDDVRIVTWPLERLEASGLPLKPRDRGLPYSRGITVERPPPVGDYKVLDGRYTTGIAGRLTELFTDGIPTVCMSLYLIPHALVVDDALAAAQAAGLPTDVVSVAAAVGSDVTNVVTAAVEQHRTGVAARLFSAYLANDVCVAVSQYTRQLIIRHATQIDEAIGTRFAGRCEQRVHVSYPAVHAAAFTDLDDVELDARLRVRGLSRDGYILFLSRLTPAKGADDLIAAYARSASRHSVELVVAGSGPSATELTGLAARAGVESRVRFLHDVDDTEKAYLMRGSAAFALPSKPLAGFTETFGIVLVEKMLAGGGPVITTTTGGIPEAVGGTALTFPAGDVSALADRLDEAIVGLDEREIRQRAERARHYALRFDRAAVFDRLLGHVTHPDRPLRRRHARSGPAPVGTAGHDAAVTAR